MNALQKYIHKRSESTECLICGYCEEDMPDSCQNEIDSGNHFAMMKQNHMFDVAFTVRSTNKAQDVTNEELLKALAMRWASLCQEFKDDLHKPYGEAFGYSDSYDVREEETK